MGVISVLAPLPVPLLLTSGGNRCAGYLAGSEHSRRKEMESS